jgi:hypothetical protein
MMQFQKDPTIALPQVNIQPKITPGPVRKQQFVVELVGPRTAPAASVQALLQPQWTSTLGNPEVYVMAAADTHWRPLNPGDQSGAYDSIALAWDLISLQGELSAASAQHLWNLAENFANQIERRAMAMPVPADVEIHAKALRDINESLDVGVNFMVVAIGDDFVEEEIWKVAGALGLDYDPSGVFVWRTSGADLFEVSPAGSHDKFSLQQVQAGATHTGLGLGFSIPLSAEPVVALDGCIHAASVFAQRLRGGLLDEDYKPCTGEVIQQIKANLGQAVYALKQVGVEPGSTEALKLFG